MPQASGNNKAVAQILRHIGALLETQGVAFKPATYRRAAHVIEELPRDVSEYGDEKELKKLPGIGDAIAGKIVEYLETGKVRALEKLLRERGGIPAELMEVENLGPKRARLVYAELGITTVAQLIEAAQKGQLRTLERFSETMEKKVLESAKRVGEHTRRFPREEIKGHVEKLLKTIKDVKGVAKCAVAGSYRREKPDVGDIDVLVVTSSPTKVSGAIARLPIVRNVAAHGERKLSFDLQNGLRVDVRFVKRDQWGSAMLYFTGSMEHNIAMRKVAIKKGWKLNEYGLFDRKGKVVASKEEKDIYEALGLAYREPTQRAGTL